jgi:microsomal dipeptidase-like Zn-dependent dipeptidase
VIVDPHAHPQSIFPSRSYDRTTPTPETLRAARLAVCAFSAVGDLAYLRGGLDAPFNDTRNQLQRAWDLAERNQVHPVLKAADLPSIGTPTAGVLALLAIEGADALEGRISHLDRFHEDGVRLLTLVHERNNELGFTQRSNTDGPLTPFGVEVVERMNVRGMLIDVAHAKTQTLKSIVDVSARPVIDSHTSPLPAGGGRGWPAPLADLAGDGVGGQHRGCDLHLAPGAQRPASRAKHAEALGRGDRHHEDAPGHGTCRLRLGQRRWPAAPA